MARGEHQQRLGLVGHRLGEEDLAQRLARRRPARLARADDAVPARRERVDEKRHVRALARAVDAFEGDEAPARRVFGHVEDRIEAMERPIGAR